MTGKGSIHKHGASGSEVAGNLSAKFPGNAVNRSFNALARGQFLQACRESLVFCADYLIASEVAYDCFLLAPPDDVDRLESILLAPIEAPTSRRWMQPPSVGASRPP
jgi:hypothetical protein